jgi:hypothetical protein
MAQKHQSNLFCKTITITGIATTLLLLFCFGVGEAISQTNPSLHDLSSGNYQFTEWDSSEPAGTYPANMRFWRHSLNDPELSDLEDDDYTLDYNLTSGVRILGDGSDGFSFLNVGTGNNHLGAAVVGLNTTDVEDVQVSWTGRTVATGGRDYRIRLQYRIGSEGTWTNVPGPVEYVNNTAGHTQEFALINMPAEFGNESEVYLKWKYYQAGSPSGTRPRLGITEITVQPAVEDPLIVRTPGSLSGFAYGEGSGPSAEQSFIVEGLNLEGDITVSPPANYEISEMSGSEFTTGNITLTESGGSVAKTILYVRLEPGLTSGQYSGDIEITSTGADTETISLSGEVTPPPPSLTDGAYVENFSDFVSTETIPNGWEVSDETYDGDWGSGSSAGLRGNASVLGYQHTSGTGTFTVTLTLQNDTGDEIENLNVSYLVAP